MKSLIVANWKCNPETLKEAEILIASVKRGIKGIKNTEVIVCPPFLYFLSPGFQMPGFKLGAQNCFWEQKGPYTGEISPGQLKNLGCSYVIVGHSERRAYLGETDAKANKKLKAALEQKLNPILCVGETEKQRKLGTTENVLKRQVLSALKGISAAKAALITVAYEPVWAIGTGNACGFEEAKEASRLIRKVIAGLYGKELADEIRIVYGGSVNGKNAAGYIKKSLVQGLLVGGASLDPKEFIKIVKSVFAQNSD